MSYRSMLRSAPVTSLSSRRSQRFAIQTTRAPGFFDVTDQVAEIVRDSGISQGFALVFARHTTAAICINEHEPLLIADMEDWLAGLAPRNVSFRHDNFAIRTVNMTPDEKPNGHAHCQRLFLPSSEMVPVDDGELCLGQWQRVFLVELDCPRPREVVVKILGI